MGTQLPLPQRGAEPPPPIFGPYLLRPNDWMDQDATCMEDGLGSGDFVLDEDPAPLPKKGAQAPAQFSAQAHCGQKAGWIKMALGMEVGLGPRHMC